MSGKNDTNSKIKTLDFKSLLYSCQMRFADEIEHNSTDTDNIKQVSNFLHQVAQCKKGPCNTTRITNSFKAYFSSGETAIKAPQDFHKTN